MAKSSMCMLEVRKFKKNHDDGGDGDSRMETARKWGEVSSNENIDSPILNTSINPKQAQIS